MINIGIIGTRRRDTAKDLAVVEEAFLALWADFKHQPATIVSGGCPRGGDRFAEVLAERHGTRMLLHLPDLLGTKFVEMFSVNPRLAHTQANYARNILIARDSSHGLIACVAPDRKGGTEHTIKQFKKFYPKGRLELV